MTQSTDQFRPETLVAIDAVIGGERGGEASTDGSPYWLVDPICGTRNLRRESHCTA